MVGLMIQSFPLLLAPAFFCNEDESTAGQQWGNPVEFSGSPWISGDLNMSRCMGPSSQVQQGTCVPSSFSKLQLWQFGPEWEEQKDAGQKPWPWSREKETPASKREKSNGFLFSSWKPPEDLCYRQKPQESMWTFPVTMTKLPLLFEASWNGAWKRSICSPEKQTQTHSCLLSSNHPRGRTKLTTFCKLLWSREDK